MLPVKAPVKAPPTDAPDGILPMNAPPIRAPVAPWTRSTASAALAQIAASVPDPPPGLGPNIMQTMAQIAASDPGPDPPPSCGFWRDNPNIIGRPVRARECICEGLGDITEKLAALTTAVASLSGNNQEVLQHIDALETSIGSALKAERDEVVKLKRALRAKNIISQGSDDIGVKDEGQVDEASPLSQGRIPVMGVPRGQGDGGPDSSSNAGESDWDHISTKCAPGLESNE